MHGSALTDRLLSMVCKHKQYLTILVGLNTGLVVLSIVSLLLTDPNRATRVITVVNFGIFGLLYLFTVPFFLACKRRAKRP